MEYFFQVLPIDWRDRLCFNKYDIINRNFIGVEPRKTWVLSRIPAGRFGAPVDVSPTAVFLAGGASDFVTGQVIAVDGGFLAGSDWNQGA